MIEKRTVCQNLSDLGDIYKPLTPEQCAKAHEFQQIVIDLHKPGRYCQGCGVKLDNSHGDYLDTCYSCEQQQRMTELEILHKAKERDK